MPDADNIRAEILDVLGITSDRLAPFPIHNASTSRVKTLIPLASAVELDRLQPDFARVEELCERIGSTGLCLMVPSEIAHHTDVQSPPIPK